MAILHDSFVRAGEVERVTEEFASIFPQADLFSAFLVEESLSRCIRSRPVKTTWMNRLPAKGSLHRYYCLLNPLAIGSLDFSKYDVVLSSSTGLAKGAVRADGAIHICYCYTPTRWMWRYDEYARTEKLGMVTGVALKPLLAGMRQIDLRASVQPDYFIAQSHSVAAQIKRHYDRNAFVIHPPLDVSRFQISEKTDHYILVLSSLLPHKRIDMMIAACNSIGKRLLIVGEGRDRARLERLAGPTIHFFGYRSEAEVLRLLSRCQAVFCPDVADDFDSMPLKANASGRPVIAMAEGSALETVVEGVSGILYKENSRPALVDAIEYCSSIAWKPMLLQSYARQFDRLAFAAKLESLLHDILGTKGSVGKAA
jgi:glycosyltransferase involved in cell wall biosynthesis